MQDKTANIYCLINPIDNNVFYVGATVSSVAKRCQQHISEARRASAEPPITPLYVRYNCINSIIYNGFLPEFKLLEAVPYDNGQEREVWWYNEMIRRGNKLFQDEYKLNYSSRKDVGKPDKKIAVYKFESEMFDTFYSKEYCYDGVLRLINDNIRNIDECESISFHASRILMTEKEFHDIVYEPSRQKLIQSFKKKKQLNTKIISN